MYPIIPKLFIVLLIICAILAGGNTTQVLTVASIFSDNMVLQRDKPITLFGTAKAGTEVKVIFNGKNYATLTDESGDWRVILDEIESGGPYSIGIISNMDTLKIQNILIGDVWLCAGQSNMEFSFKNDIDAKSVINFQDKGLRIHTVDDIRRKNFSSNVWCRSDSSSVSNFSAIGYYFGRNLRSELDIPIGMVDISKGATACESWINREVLENTNDYYVRSIYEKYLDFIALEDFDKDRLFYLDSLQLDYNQKMRDYKKGLLTEKTKPLDIPNIRKLTGSSYTMYLDDFLPFAVKGVLWYQGESNSHTKEDGQNYGKLLTLMINNWRDQWNDIEIPFYVVQLPEFDNDRLAGWSDIRISQMNVALNNDNVDFIVTTDIRHSVPSAIHPPVKKPIAERLVKMVLKKTYKKDVQIEFPYCDVSEIQIRGDNVIIPYNSSFGLKISQPSIRGFEILSSDGIVDQPAAHMKNKTVILELPPGLKPSTIQYNCNQNLTGNLFNQLGYPAAPFCWKSK